VGRSRRGSASRVQPALLPYLLSPAWCCSSRARDLRVTARSIRSVACSTPTRASGGALPGLGAVRWGARARLSKAQQRACIYVSNHQSMVDILAVFALRTPFLWVSKVENFLVPFLGWNMWLNGYVPLKRGHLRASCAWCALPPAPR